MRNVREQLNQGSRLLQPTHEEPRAAASSTDPGGLTSVLVSLRFRKAQVGKMPGAPPTLRGRCGALLVGAVRRSLFWLIKQLDDFDTQIVEACDS